MHHPVSWSCMTLHSPRVRLGLPSLFICLLLGLGLLSWARLNIRHDISITDPYIDPSPPDHETQTAIVMRKMPYEDISWLSSLLPQKWKPYIYTHPTDPSPSHLNDTVNLNLPPNSKGRESSAYLTYIIDHYDSLHPITLFIHASETQWHNDIVESKSTLDLLTKLRLDIFKENETGFANLRCQHPPGCPIAVRPFDTVFREKENPVFNSFDSFYTGLFNFSGGSGSDAINVPHTIAAPCCSQFVVSRGRIRARRKEEYIHMRDWAMGNTELDDLGVGSVFEMVWHVVFGEESIFCPDTRTCYCELYGLCD